MHRIKWLTPFVFCLAIVLSLSACGTTWDKPTGLENTEHEHIEGNLNSDVDVNEHVEKDAEVNEDEADSDVNRETESPDKTESYDKNVTANSESEHPIADSEKDVPEKDAHPTENKQPDQQSSAHKQDAETEGNSSSPQTIDKESPKKSEEKHKPKKDKPKDKPQNKKEPVIPDPEPEPDPEPDPEPEQTIKISIVISSKEIPLPPTELAIKDGDTVIDALIAVTKKNGLQLDFSGGKGSMSYIKGIANVYEFDRGQGSGWMFRINGIFPNRGAGVIKLMAGDRVEFLYTTNLGQDLDADLKPFR